MPGLGYTIYVLGGVLLVGLLAGLLVGVWYRRCPFCSALTARRDSRCAKCDHRFGKGGVDG